MQRRKPSLQRDLFAPREPAPALPPDVAKRLLPLLQQLLLEVMASEVETVEKADDQDHA